MANRPVFIPRVDGMQFVDEVMIDFKWVPGMAISQKIKNVLSLHSAAQQKGITPVLEISTKSQLPLGVALSAFNLSIDIPEIGQLSVEAAFQGSKVFQFGGPYQEFYGMTGREIRQDNRLKSSGNLLYFDLGGDKWKLDPKTAFYDWLYLCGLWQNPELSNQLLAFNGFTDIEFNPQKSINCQARSAALFVSVRRLNCLNRVMRSKQDYLAAIQKSSTQSLRSEKPEQPPLFEL